MAREQAQRSAREIGIPAERLVRTDQRVASEGHGDSGGQRALKLIEGTICRRDALGYC
jgi:hypothetical protein